jgi:hypothetical protein
MPWGKRPLSYKGGAMGRLLGTLCVFTLVLGVAGLTAGGPRIKGAAVEYSAQGMVIKGYLAYAEDITGPRPGVLVVHMSGGGSMTMPAIGRACWRSSGMRPLPWT